MTILLDGRPGRRDIERTARIRNSGQLLHGVTATLSKVAVARAVLLPLFTAKPMETFCAMLIV
jgi:hypothetical protein